MGLSEVLTYHLQKHQKSDSIELDFGLKLVNRKGDFHVIANTQKIPFTVAGAKENFNQFVEIANIYRSSMASAAIDSNKVRNFNIKDKIRSYFNGHTDRRMQLAEHLETALDRRYGSKLMKKQAGYILSSNEEFRVFTTQTITSIRDSANLILNISKDDINYIQEEAFRHGWMKESIVKDLYTLPELKSPDIIPFKGITV